MKWKEKVIIILIIFILLSFIKFFTAKIGYQGDPTIALVLKSTPTISNSYLMKGEENSTYIYNKMPAWYTQRKYKVIAGDEHGFTGEMLYNFVIFSWWILSIGLLIRSLKLVSLHIGKRANL